MQRLEETELREADRTVGVNCYIFANDDVFDDFPKNSRHFPKISEDSLKVVRRPDDRLRTFPKCPKIAEDNRRFTRKNR